MKVYELAAVIDCGDVWEVEYTTTSLSADFEKNATYLGLNNIANLAINDALENNKIIRIPKDIQNIDVMVSDLIIIGDDDNDIDFHKKLMLKKARQQVTHQQANVSGIIIYEYTVINNYLNSKGYFIHDDNREEEYLKILETGDEKLIDKLELFLNAKDQLAMASSLEQLYSNFYEKVRESTEIIEIDQAYNTFMISARNGAK